VSATHDNPPTSNRIVPFVINTAGLLITSAYVIIFCVYPAGPSAAIHRSTLAGIAGLAAVFVAGLVLWSAAEGQLIRLHARPWARSQALDIPACPHVDTGMLILTF
jgi:hypothetical protein